MLLHMPAHQNPAPAYHQGQAVFLPPESPLLPDLAVVASGDEETLDSLSLVLSAMGIDHYIDEEEGRLLTKQKNYATALAHIQRYQGENQNWPPPPPQHPPFYNQHQPSLALMLLLLFFFFHTGPWSADNQWFSLAANDSKAILQGHQWWRLVTSLTLHADLVHVVSNCLIGGIIVHLLGQMTGYGLAWLLLVTNGAAGNLLNILIRNKTHLSVGFSTAIFAAIGIFTGLQILRGKVFSAKKLLLPLGAGLALLAFLGSGGERTDLGAHFFGLLVGIGCGLLLGASGLMTRLLQSRPQTQITIQTIFFSLAAAMVALAWFFALRASPAP